MAVPCALFGALLAVTLRELTTSAAETTRLPT
jgi:hypothetical protein